MKEQMHIDRYICDLCGCQKDVPHASTSCPMCSVTLPVKVFDEYGYYQQKISTASFDLCEQCQRELVAKLDTFYDIGHFMCCGSYIKKKK